MEVGSVWRWGMYAGGVSMKVRSVWRQKAKSVLIALK